MNATLDKIFEAFGIRDAAGQEAIVDLLQRSGVPLDVEFTPPPEQPKPALVMLDPASIKIDAATYQFRFNGDSNGITRKGRYDTDHWNPILHGDPLLVHERLDGTFYVADGHHRLDLAKRLNAAGNGPGEVAAMVLREVDGYSPHDVKIIAAYKNIAHGQTDAYEAAKVFQEARQVNPAMLPELEMDKGNLPLSRHLSELSAPALECARQEVPVEVAAEVSKLVPNDPTRRESIMRLVGDKLESLAKTGHVDALDRRAKDASQLTR